MAVTELERIMSAVGAVGAFGATFVLPGFGIGALTPAAPRRRGVERPAADEGVAYVFARAVASSVVFVCSLGYVLIAAGLFTNARMAVAVVPLALLGVPRAVRWARAAVTRWQLLVPLGVVGAVYSASAFEAGHAPAHSYNWYYWLLARDLTIAHGIPQWVLEYGSPVRWQPDYLSFDVLVESYRGFFGASDPVLAFDAWKVPVAFLTIGLTFAAFRLWFGRYASLVGTVGLAATILFTTKLGNGRPEVVAFALGLAGLIVGVHGLRQRQPRAYLLAAAVFGIAASVHAIGALVVGAAFACATVIELIAQRRDWKPLVRFVGAGAALTIVVVVSTGFALQGRAFVGRDAGRPQASNSSDPTWDFLERSGAGRFTSRPLPDLSDELSGFVTEPVSGFELGHGWGLALAVVLGAAPVIAVFVGGRAVRQGALVFTGVALALVAGATWFAVRYTTFVPRHTGLSRFTQWTPWVYVAAATALLAAIEARTHGSRRVGRFAAAVVALLLTAAVAIHARGEISGDFQVDDEHIAAVEALQRQMQPGDIVLSNANTWGNIEFLTDAEVPAEGRQPLIEEPDVLDNANRFLVDLHTYLENPAAIDPAAEFGARWVLVTAKPRRLGGSASYGGSLAAFASVPTLTPVWQSTNVALYRTNGNAQPVRRVGPLERPIARSIAAVALVGAVLGFAMALTSGRLPRRVRTR